MSTKATKNRQSAEIPGLSYELRQADGSYYVVFRYINGAFDGYVLQGGTANWADCSDRAHMPSRVYDHCRKVATALAARLTGKPAAA